MERSWRACLPRSADADAHRCRRGGPGRPRQCLDRDGERRDAGGRVLAGGRAHLCRFAPLRPRASDRHAGGGARGRSRHPSVDRTSTRPGRGSSCSTHTPAAQPPLDRAAAPARCGLRTRLGAHLRRDRRCAHSGAASGPRPTTRTSRCGARAPASGVGTARGAAPCSRLHRWRLARGEFVLRQVDPNRAATFRSGPVTLDRRRAHGRVPGRPAPRHSSSRPGETGVTSF
jgi:hypothetical protein